MFKISLLFLTLTASLTLAAARVPIWGQCGGKTYTGETTCDDGLECVFSNDFYSQCKQSSGPNPSSTTTKSNPTTTKPNPSPSPSTSKSGPTTTTSKGGSGGPCHPLFPQRQFKVGVAYESVNNMNQNDYDYISIWSHTISPDFGNKFNPWHQGKMLDQCKAKNKMPCFYGYGIAHIARRIGGHEDCDVDPNGPNLCRMGAKFIRDNRAMLVQAYADYAADVAKYYGSDKPVLWKMEPDFWQYYGDNKQTGGTLSGEYAAALFNDFVAGIKKSLPKSIISWDISAWIGEDGFRKWWSYFKNSPIDFIHTSGGQSQGQNEALKPGELTWAFVSSTTGLKIIADCGYGINGAPDDSCKVWNDANTVNNRIKNGVISVTIGSTSGGLSMQKPPVNC